MFRRFTLLEIAVLQVTLLARSPHRRNLTFVRSACRNFGFRFLQPKSSTNSTFSRNENQPIFFVLVLVSVSVKYLRYG